MAMAVGLMSVFLKIVTKGRKECFGSGNKSIVTECLVSCVCGRCVCGSLSLDSAVVCSP